METILVIGGLLALAAFFAGVVLLVLYLRAGRDRGEPGEPVLYGNLAQCPNCGYMNPANSPACLNCRTEFRPRRAAPPPVVYPALSPPRPEPIPSPQVTRATYSPAPAPVEKPPAPRPPGSGQSMPVAWLDALAGEVGESPIWLTEADTLFGRSQSCDVQIFDPKVSRQHFRIRYGNGAFFMQDQDSSRGTFINGKRAHAQRLNDGDQIDVGDARLVFHVDG